MAADPVVWTGAAGAVGAMPQSHHSGPGKYGSSGPARNTMCGIIPLHQSLVQPALEAAVSVGSLDPEAYAMWLVAA